MTCTVECDSAKLEHRHDDIEEEDGGEEGVVHRKRSAKFYRTPTRAGMQADGVSSYMEFLARKGIIVRALRRGRGQGVRRPLQGRRARPRWQQLPAGDVGEDGEAGSLI